MERLPGGDHSRKPESDNTKSGAEEYEFDFDKYLKSEDEYSFDQFRTDYLGEHPRADSDEHPRDPKQDQPGEHHEGQPPGETPPNHE